MIKSFEKSILLSFLLNLQQNLIQKKIFDGEIEMRKNTNF